MDDSKITASKDNFVNWLYDQNNGQLPDRATFSQYLTDVIDNSV